MRNQSGSLCTDGASTSASTSGGSGRAADGFQLEATARRVSNIVRQGLSFNAISLAPHWELLPNLPADFPSCPRVLVADSATAARGLKWLFVDGRPLHVC